MGLGETGEPLRFLLGFTDGSSFSGYESDLTMSSKVCLDWSIISVMRLPRNGYNYRNQEEKAHPRRDEPRRKRVSLLGDATATLLLLDFLVTVADGSTSGGNDDECLAQVFLGILAGELGETVVVNDTMAGGILRHSLVVIQHRVESLAGLELRCLVLRTVCFSEVRRERSDEGQARLGVVGVDDAKSVAVACESREHSDIDTAFAELLKIQAEGFGFENHNA